MNAYYFANQVYQLSYAWPLYSRIGGEFMVRKYRTLLKFKKFLRGSTKEFNRETPPVRRRKLSNVSELTGIIFSQSNARIRNNRELSRSIFIGHGTGDKKYGEKSHTLLNYQHIFVSGPKHMEKLKDSNLVFPEEALVKTGNLRFDDYVNSKLNKDAIFNRLGVPPADRDRKTVLYAPTWGRSGGTLEKYARLFMKEITKEHNLVIRPHHFDSHKVPVLKLWAKMNGIRRVYFSNSNRIADSDTMHDFMISDILISDTSSVLYEYLITGQPIIVADTDFGGLHSMPDSMNIIKIADFFDNTKGILDAVNRNLAKCSNSERYSEMLHNCFYFNDGKSVERAVEFVNYVAEELNQ